MIMLSSQDPNIEIILNEKNVNFITFNGTSYMCNLSGNTTLGITEEDYNSIKSKL